MALTKVSTNVLDVDLSDGGESSAHYHDSDRVRTNHTGTQSASTIDDFQSGVNANTLVSTMNTKLTGIDTGAKDDQTGAEIKSAYEGESDTNAFTDAEKTKLDGISAGAGVTMTDGEIKTAYENNADTNEFSDTEQTKLAGIEASADVNLTSSQMLTAIKTVDGASSGLDADLLDGVEESALSLADGTRAFTGTVDGVSPTGSNNLATKGYVDGVASGLAVHDPVRMSSTVELTVTYDNGTAGVGATLTNADTQAAFAVDGVTGVASNRVMIKDQTSNPEQNGIYDVTTVGDGSTNWVLTRATDFDNSPTQEIHDGDYFFVGEGTVNEHLGFVQTTAGTVTVGTTDINFAQFSGAGQITAGTGLDKTGNEIFIDSTTMSSLAGKEDSVAGKALSENDFTDALLSKLNDVDASADVNQSDATIKTQYENNSDTNAFTDTLLSKLNGIDASADVNPTNSEIKTAYETNSDTNAFTDALLSKLNGLVTSSFEEDGNGDLMPIA